MRFTFTNRAAPFCEVGFYDVRIDQPTAGVWDSHHWDEEGVALWSGSEPTWRDVSCEVYQATTEAGRAALTDRYVAGTANLLLRNLDGWADPSQEGMRPGRAIRFGVDHIEFGRIILFRGFIDAVIPTYDPVRQPTVELQCIDALGEVNRGALIPFDEPFPGRGDLADRRLSQILDRTLWPRSKRDIHPSSWTLVEDAQGGQVADLLSRVADSAGGVVWGDHEGRIAFRPRDYQMYGHNDPVDGVIGNVEPTDICPGTWVRPMDRASFSTKVIMGRDAETAIEVNDSAGQVLYGIESFERVDLLTLVDSNIADLAERTLELRSHTTSPRVRSVTLDARNGFDQLDLMATVDIFAPSHYRCRLMEYDGRIVFDDRYMATAAVHHITADDWHLDLNLDIAKPYEVGSTRWDEASWDEDLWSNNARLAETRPTVSADERMLAWH